MDFNISKENVQPLRGGRDAVQLGVALQAQTDMENQKELIQQREQFEKLIQTYTGDDPLQNWYNYISWVEQSYPRQGNGGSLELLLEHCLKLFENDRRYTNDRRLCKLFIKYFDFQQHPLESYHMMYAQGLCRGCADLYRAWAYYHEAASDFQSANKVFEYGKHALAQPYEELLMAHQNLIVAAGKHIIYGPNERSLSEKREALTSLCSYSTEQRVATSGSSGPTTYDSTINLRSNVNIPIYVDGGDEKEAVEAGPISIITAARKQEVPKENTMKPGPWTTIPVNKRHAVQKFTPSFRVHEDDGDENGGVKMRNFVAATLENYSDWIVCLTLPEPKDDKFIAMYPKSKVYSEIDTEYSLEELRATRYFSKKTRLRVAPAETDQAVESILGNSNLSLKEKRGPQGDFYSTQVPKLGCNLNQLLTTSIVDDSEKHENKHSPPRSTVFQNLQQFVKKVPLCEKARNFKALVESDAWNSFSKCAVSKISSYEQHNNIGIESNGDSRKKHEENYLPTLENSMDHSYEQQNSQSSNQEQNSNLLDFNVWNSPHTSVDRFSKKPLLTFSIYEQSNLALQDQIKSKGLENNEDAPKEHDENYQLTLPNTENQNYEPQNQQLSIREHKPNSFNFDWGSNDRSFSKEPLSEFVISKQSNLTLQKQIKPRGIEIREDTPGKHEETYQLTFLNSGNRSHEPYNSLSSIGQQNPSNLSNFYMWGSEARLLEFAISKQSNLALQEEVEPKGSAMKTPINDLNAEELAETGSRGGMDVAAAAPVDGAKRLPLYDDDSSSSFDQISDQANFRDDSCSTQMFAFNLNAMKVSTPRNKQEDTGYDGDASKLARKQLFTENSKTYSEKADNKVLSTIFEETKYSGQSSSSNSSGITTKSCLFKTKQSNMGTISEEHNSYLAQNLMVNAALRSSSLGDLMDLGHPSTSTMDVPQTEASGDDSNGHSSSSIPTPTKSSPLHFVPSDPFKQTLIDKLLEKVCFPGPHTSGFYRVNVIQKLYVRKETVSIGADKYVVEKQLGKGTYGTVFRGVDLRTGNTVALKHQKPANRWEFYICRELQSRLAHHPLRERFMDITTGYFSSQASVLVSKFMPWGSLLDVANTVKQKSGRTMKESLSIHFCLEMLKVVEAMHKVKIIHADIKPDNFLVQLFPNDTVGLHLIDFGCSIDMALFPKGTSFTRKVTTEDFICCEMIDGRPWNYHTDLFCVAATAHVLLFEKYIQLQKKEDLWSISNRLPRYARLDLWNMFFSTLLNQQNGPADSSSLQAMLEDSLYHKFDDYHNDLRYLINILKNR